MITSIEPALFTTIATHLLAKWQSAQMVEQRLAFARGKPNRPQHVVRDEVKGRDKETPSRKGKRKLETEGKKEFKVLLRREIKRGASSVSERAKESHLVVT